MFRLFNHYFSRQITILSFVEVITLFYAAVLAYQLRLALPANDGQYVGAAIFSASMLMAMVAVGLYSSRVVSLRMLLHRLLVAGFIALLTMSLVFYLFQGVYVGRGVVLYSAALGISGVVIVRMAYFWLTDADMLKRRVLILGNREEANRIIELARTDSRFNNIQIKGFYEAAPEDESFRGQRRDPATLQQLANAENVDEIVLAVRERRGGVLPLRELLDCKLAGIKVVDLVSFYEREAGMLPIENLKASWLLAGDGFDVGRWRDIGKRVFDVLASGLIIVISAPVLAVAAVAIVVESGFPVLYRQNRVGAGGRVFSIVKLRSMRQNAESDGNAQWAKIDDPRITWVGSVIRATRIDELPQLFNVLMGEMSFVGPRPERPEFVRQLLGQVPFYDVRHNVKPGVTGWAQVRYTYGASIADAVTKLQYDLYYVKNHSLVLDLLIMVETLEVVFLRKGAR